MMLRLASSTEPDWAPSVLKFLPQVLMDHAHCEKRAASTAINLMFRYADRTQLLVPLSELAREELRHFEQVLEQLQSRDLKLRVLQSPPYAKLLHQTIRSKEPHRLLDTLCCCALIEARSCERMQLLSSALTDEPLSAWYSELVASEARHFTLYTTLAQHWFSKEEVWERFDQLAEQEAEIIKKAPPMARLHGGVM